MGNLPASTLGLRNRNDDQLAHRVGPIGSRPPPDVLRPPVRVANPLVEGIRSYQRGVQSVLPKVRVIIVGMSASFIINIRVLVAHHFGIYLYKWFKIHFAEKSEAI